MEPGVGEEREEEKEEKKRVEEREEREERKEREERGERGESGGGRRGKGGGARRSERGCERGRGEDRGSRGMVSVERAERRRAADEKGTRCVAGSFLCDLRWMSQQEGGMR